MSSSSTARTALLCFWASLSRSASRSEAPLLGELPGGAAIGDDGARGEGEGGDGDALTGAGGRVSFGGWISSRRLISVEFWLFNSRMSAPPLAPEPSRR